MLVMLSLMRKKNSLKSCLDNDRYVVGNSKNYYYISNIIKW